MLSFICYLTESTHYLTESIVDQYKQVKKETAETLSALMSGEVPHSYPPRFSQYGTTPTSRETAYQKPRKRNELGLVIPKDLSKPTTARIQFPELDWWAKSEKKNNDDKAHYAPDGQHIQIPMGEYGNHHALVGAIAHELAHKYQHTKQQSDYKQRELSYINSPNFDIDKLLKSPNETIMTSREHRTSTPVLGTRSDYGSVTDLVSGRYRNRDIERNARVIEYAVSNLGHNYHKEFARSIFKNPSWSVEQHKTFLRNEHIKYFDSLENQTHNSNRELGLITPENLKRSKKKLGELIYHHEQQLPSSLSTPEGMRDYAGRIGYPHWDEHDKIISQAGIDSDKIQNNILSVASETQNKPVVNTISRAKPSSPLSPAIMSTLEKNKAKLGSDS